MDLDNKLKKLSNIFNNILINSFNQNKRIVCEKKIVDLALKSLSSSFLKNSTGNSNFILLNDILINRIKFYRNTINSDYNQSFVLRIELSINDVGHKPILNNRMLSLAKSIVFNLRRYLRSFNTISISKELGMCMVSSVTYSNIFLHSMSSKQSVLSSPHVDKIGQTTYVKEFNKSRVILMIPIHYISLSFEESTFNILKKNITRVLEVCSPASSKMRISGEFFFN